MANVKISELTAITSSDDLADVDIVPIVDSSDSSTKRVALSVLCTFFGAGGGGGSSVWCTGTNTVFLLTDCVGIGTATPGTDIMFRVQGDSCYTGDLKIAGDVCINGNDLFMGTNTSGQMLIADGTNFSPVAMSGDIGINSSGVTTIQASAVENSMLAGSIANAKLSNSSVSYGGVSLSLGGTDATPAFNLCDATGYKTTNLVGTITNDQLAGSISNDKLAGSIANSKLANDSVSYGGVEVDLGSTDATPAFNLCDATGYQTSNLAGTITNSQLAGSIANDKLAGSIANDKLANSSVSYGGVSVSLGGTDATPAFNLCDATGYQTTNLVGTITSAQIAGSIANSKLANDSVSYGGVEVELGAADATPAFNLCDATGYKTTNLSGTITNAQLAGSIASDKLAGSIANSKLANSSVSYGGVSLSLGGTDATPAFNLCDATGYPTSSLVGTITNTQLAGSIANSKLANDSVSYGGVELDLGTTDATPAFNLCDATGYKTTSLAGTITNAQLAGSISNDKLAGSIANSKLSNSSVSYGGVELALGATDATPAFNLCDATAYQTSNLVGTITNAQLAGSIANDKLAGSIANNKLANDSVSYGGVEVDLGAADASPAFNLCDATGYKGDSALVTVGTITTGVWNATAITNANLANSTVSYGGIAVALGATDDTPAFNLCDATGYQTSNLAGTITNAQLAGSIANSKLANDSVSYGGISLDLGETDDSPAFNLCDATGYKTTNLAGTITNAQLAGSIANAKLSNSSVSYGGVSLSLGGTDATPAFNLCDATAYPTSSLVGTITNAQLAGSIANSKLVNDSVSYGGVSVDLGSTDDTPAFNLCDATGYKTTNLSGTITNSQLAGSIANAKLSNNSVSYGGVEVALGATDATPAFNLCDATGYQTSNLAGTITNAQLAGSIANSKLSNDSVSYGGVSLDLGQTDASPAFNLCDATGYKGDSALVTVGTITSGVWNGTAIATTHVAGTLCDKTLASPVLCGTISGDAFLDEDNMASNSATKVASQQSIKAYVDSVATGLDLKCSSHVATTANLSSSYNNGSSGVGATLTNNTTQAALSIDGQTMVVGERVLVKDQSTASQNGIYTVTTVGDGSTNWVLTRATDFDTSTKITSGAFTFVETGSTNADSGFVLTTDGSITVGTTSLTWSQFSGAGQITAGDGLTKSGNTLNVGAGSNLLVSSDAVAMCSIITGLTTVCATNFAGTLATAAQTNVTSLGTLTSLTVDNISINGTTIGHTDDTDLITLADGSVTIAGDLTISGDDLTMATNTSGHILVADGTNYNPVAVSGDVTINGSGAVTIADSAVENSMLAGSIANAKLSNSSVSYGGVSVALGATDATPAFNLCDATGYQTSNLAGTITNAQLAGSIANSKLSNDSVSYGGIELDLGTADATPAFNLCDATGYKTSNLAGTITNAQLAGSIANDKLSNNSVSYGGVEVSLGATDATPAFNLCDATAYPTSSLVGTITNAQLAGSIANSKLSNDSVSYGGVSVDLGAADATPAFNLCDATGYKTSNLAGTITNAQLAGSIANAKLSNSSITVTDGSSSTAISLGGTVTFSGTSNEVEVGESSGTVTVGLPAIVSGLTTVCATNFAGTLATAAQTNITSLGTLTALTVDNVSINGATIGHTDDTDLITLADGSVTIAGDLTVSGDDLTMGTNTAGHILVADGTNYNPVAVSGDITINSAGAVTIAATSVENSMLAGSIANAKLSNSSVSYGGVELALGATDATPAFNLCDATGFQTSNLSGTITNAQLAGSIANSKLSNNSVSYGGIELALGETDATPAFNLCDATAYKTSNLAGTITNAQLAGSIANSKLSNDSVSYGGVEVDLGATDATPAFNLCDATGYKTTNLAGTITNTQLAGSISNDKLAGSIANAKLSNSSITVCGAGSNSTAISLGNAVTFSGTSNEIEVAESSGTVTIGLPSIITGLTTVCATNFAGTLATAAQTNVTSLGTLTALTVDNVSINGATIGHTDDTDLITLADGTVTIAGDLTISGDDITMGTNTAGHILVADGTNYNPVAVSGDITINSAGAVTIASSSVENSMLAGSIANAKLANDSVSFGGVSVDLGAADATPAFNLCDATAYKTSNLAGTITNAQLAGSIANAKLSNDSVSYGGVSLDLGGADATPAFNLCDATGYKTSNLAGTITNAQLAGSIANDKLAGSIANAKLANSSVSYGGVELALGATDATPAFNLCDATAYPTSSLVGTITNSQLAGSIANAKLSNDSVSYGGIELDLGEADATPAFNLCDATAYKGDSALVTSGALNSGSITNGFGNIDNGSSTLTTGAATVSSLSVGDGNITNVGDIAVDTISGDGDANTTIGFPGSDVLTLNTGGSERVRIDSNGKVGIGAEPRGTTFFEGGHSAALQIEGTSPTTSGLSLVRANANFGPSLILGRTCGSVGGNDLVAANQSLGAISWQANDGTDFVQAALIEGRVGNHMASNCASGELRFYTNAGSNGSVTVRAIIDEDGNVGIGTTTPVAAFHLNNGASVTNLPGNTRAVFSNGNGADAITRVGIYAGGASAFSVLDLGRNDANCRSSFTYNTSADSLTIGTAGSASALAITSAGEVYIQNSSDQGAFNLQVGGTGVHAAGAYVNGSDEALKHSIEVYDDNALDIVSEMKPVTFEYKESYSSDRSTQIGFIAQDLQKVLEGKSYLNGVVKDGGEYLNVAYQSLIPILTKALQEATVKIKTLETKVAALETTL